MAKKKTSALPRLEIMIIIVFFLSFIFWAVPQCSSTKAEIQAQAAEEELEDLILDSLQKAEQEQLIKEKEEENPKPPKIPPSNERVTLLYVTIDGMNVRTAPSTNSQVIDRLKLFDEVIFLNEVTDSTEKINLGSIVTDEPWVKIQTKKGREGWIYGAGLSYYKKKLEGVE